MINRKEKHDITGKNVVFDTRDKRTNLQPNNSTHRRNFNNDFSPHHRPPTATNAGAKLTRHLVYHRLLLHLENWQVCPKGERQTLPFILHEATKAGLREQHSLSERDIEAVENSIVRDVETMTDYETVRDVPAAVYRLYKEQGRPNFIFDNRIVSIPNSIENAHICEQLEKKFSRAELSSVSGFITTSERDEETGVTHTVVRLDLDEKLCRSGFIAPVVRDGLIVGLKVYRYPHDLKPFVLRSRVGGLYR